MSAFDSEEKTPENTENVLNLYKELKKKFVELEICKMFSQSPQSLGKVLDQISFYKIFDMIKFFPYLKFYIIVC